jgi:hypothetical protein
MRCPRCQSKVPGLGLFEDLRCPNCSAKLKHLGTGALVTSQVVAYICASILLLVIEPTATAILVILIVAGILGIVVVWWLWEPAVENEQTNGDSSTSKG